MKKHLHLHYYASDLTQSTAFYTRLFGLAPDKQKKDYVRWTLENPALVFALSTHADKTGLAHLGFRVNTESDWQTMTNKLSAKRIENHADCCYASSQKAWLEDPDQLPWELYRNRADIDAANKNSSSACCQTKAREQSKHQACC